MNANGHKPCILIADDEEMVIVSIKAFLQLLRMKARNA